MKTLRLDLSSRKFSISVPTEIIPLLETLYPYSLTESPEFDASRFVLSRGQDAWRLSRNGSPLGRFDRPVAALLALEYRLERDVAQIGDGCIAFHAGAVATAGGAWLLAGNRDTGKTSSTFQLLELGQRFLCEEIALYDPARREVHPHLQSLSLEPRFVELCERSRSLEQGLVRSFDADSVRYVPLNIETSPQRPSALLLPRYRPGSEPTVAQLPEEDALIEVAGFCFQPQGGEERFFDALIDLLSRVPVLRVTYPDSERARDLYRDLLAAPVLDRP